MSIQGEINRINGNIGDTYTALATRGATMPAMMNSDNLASTVNTIELTGITTLNNQTITQWISIASPTTAEDTVMHNAGYNYKGLISVDGCSGDIYPSITFTRADSISGKLSNLCFSTVNGVFIYATEQIANLSIPTITLSGHTDLPSDTDIIGGTWNG